MGAKRAAAHSSYDHAGERLQDVNVVVTLGCTLPTGYAATLFSFGDFMDANVSSERRDNTCTDIKHVFFREDYLFCLPFRPIKFGVAMFARQPVESE